MVKPQDDKIKIPQDDIASLKLYSSGTHIGGRGNKQKIPHKIISEQCNTTVKQIKYIWERYNNAPEN